jgi:hypothetical protein
MGLGVPIKSYIERKVMFLLPKLSDFFMSLRGEAEVAFDSMPS